ncbi:MAG: DUF1446 domain-containing protein [Firmicutes bacterium]|nr:DUF1446 domain-containing protein [Bacillota bacterium]
MRKLTVLSPTAILGYGFPKESFERGLQHNPDVIAVDAGSVDPGPYYLGAGVSFTDKAAVKRDLEIILPAARKRNIPVLIGSAGGAGAKPHLEWTEEIIKEIAAEQDLAFKLALIAADVDEELLLDNLESTEPLGPIAPLNKETVQQTSNIVAQMGVEPIVAALDAGADVVLAGRAYDPTVFAAEAVRRGFDPGPALHMGKILECAAIAAEPGSGRDCMVGILDGDGFEIFPPNPQRQCTIKSVAAHSLYEKSNPWLLPGPGGSLDLQDTIYEQVEPGRVRVTGTRYVADKHYRLKLEGARLVGYRTLAIAGIRDPLMIKELRSILDAVSDSVRENFESVPDYKLNFLCYGLDGVMKELEPTPQPGHEVGLIIDVVAGTQDDANTICSYCRSTLLHYGYPGRVSTAGNLALPYSPSDLKAGPVYEFSVHHLLAVPVEFRPLIQEVGGKSDG